MLSADNTIEVMFNSRTVSDTKKFRGFSATYRFITDYGINTGTQDNSKACNFVYDSQLSINGTFTSPNYPGFYPRSTECHYIFIGQEGERVYIQFLTFDVEGLTGCLEDTQSDYVELSNFNVKVTDRKMSRLCGQKDTYTNRKKFVSDNNFFRVTFHSDDMYDGSGFMATYEFRKVEDSNQLATKRPRSSAMSNSSRLETVYYNILLCAVVVVGLVLATCGDYSIRTYITTTTTT